MEDEYANTIPVDDTVDFGSPIAESRVVSLDMDTEIVDVCESASHTGDQMEDHLEKGVVLDSDDEGGDRNKNLNQVDSEYVPVSGRFSGRGTIRLLKQQQVHDGCFQSHSSKFGDHILLRLDPDKSVGNDEKSNSRSSVLHGDRFGEHSAVMDNMISKSPDQKPVSINADEVPLVVEYLDMARESLPKHSLDKRMLSSHEYKSSNAGKGSNYGPESTELNLIESPVPSDSHDKVLDFVNHYLSISDLGLYEAAKTRKSSRIKSPPSLWSKGSQTLARRINRGFSDCKLMTLNWDTKENGKNEYSFLSTNENSYAHQVSDHVNLQMKITSFPSRENFPGLNDLDANALNSNDINKLGSDYGICVEYDMIELDEQLDEGISRQNVERCEQLMHTLDDSLDIGLNTQIAAEAMEALIHATPALDADFGHPCSDNKLLKSSNAANEESKSDNVIYPNEAFIGWRCKAKRSRCMKITPVLLKNRLCSATNQSGIQRGNVVQLPTCKKLRTENLRIVKDLSSGSTINTRNCKGRGPHEVTLKQPRCGFNARGSLRDSRNHLSLYDRKSKEAISVIKSDSPPKQGKMISLHDDMCQKAVRGNCLKLNSDPYFRVEMDSVEGEDNYHLNVTDKTLVKLNWWACPKGKRTRQYAPCKSLRSRIPCSSRATIKAEVICSLGNEKAHEKVEDLLVYTRRSKFSITDSCSPSVNDSPFSVKKVKISTEYDTANRSEQFDKSGGREPPPVESDNEHLMGVQIFEGSDNAKQPCNYLSKSPLMKELTRLGYTESLPDFLPKNSRRRKAMDKVCILFSQNLKPSIIKQQRKIVAKLGLSIASCCADATHFVTDWFVRTKNLLEAIALGKPVVTHIWLESCEQAGYVVDEKNYILRDEKKEKEIGFNMSVSLTCASQRPLLKDRVVFMTPNVKPSMDVITGLVKAVRGQAVQTTVEAQTEDKAVPDDLLVLSCQEDFKICMPFLNKGTSVYDSELLLNGIVTQKLEYERYELFKNYIKDISGLPWRRNW